MLILFFMFAASLAQNFAFQVEPDETQCLSDYLKANTVLALQVIANSTEFDVKIKSGRQVLQQYNKEILIRYTVTLPVGDNISYCFHVFGSRSVKFDINYKKGADVNDKSQLAHKTDLNPIEDLLSDVDRQLKNIKQNTIPFEENDIETQFQIEMLSLTTMAISVFSSLAIAFVIKRQMKLRKDE